MQLLHVGSMAYLRRSGHTKHDEVAVLVELDIHIRSNEHPEHRFLDSANVELYLDVRGEAASNVSRNRWLNISMWN